MKKHLFVCALMITTIHSYGQFSFGVKGGINVNNIELRGLPSGWYDYKSSVGFHFGLYGRFKLTKTFSIEPELQFCRRGATITNPALPSGTKWVLDYVDIPILVSYAPFKKISFELGPNSCYKISARIKGKNFNFNDNQNVQDIDFGIMSGLTLHLTNKVSIVGRYYYGITALHKSVDRDANNNQITISSHNSTIQFGLGYKIK